MKIHTLLGVTNLNISCRCLRSLIECSTEQISLIVHDDGSLNQSSREHLRSCLSPMKMKIVGKAEADAKIRSLLHHFPWCLKTRDSHPLGLKLFDIPLLSTEDRLIYIDSDVCFHRPFSLAGIVTAESPMWMMTDIGNAYAFDWKRYFLLRCRHPFSRIRLPEKANSGFFSLNRSSYDIDLFESWLSKKAVRAMMKFWPRLFEQTLWAMLLANQNGLLLDPGQVLIPPAQGVIISDLPSLIGIHYVGGIRHLIPPPGPQSFFDDSSQPLRLQPAKPLSISQHFISAILRRIRPH